jgi:signal transduction histidine kinase
VPSAILKWNRHPLGRIARTAYLTRASLTYATLKLSATPMRLRPRHVRTRLTLWYLAVVALALVVYAASTDALVLYQLRDQLDRLAIEDLETVEGFLQFSHSGALVLREDYHDYSYPANVAERLMEVYDSSGHLLYRNGLLANRSLGPAPAPNEGAAGYNPHSLRLSDGTPVRVVSKRHSLHGRPVLIRIGFSEAPLFQRLRQVSLGLLAGLPAALALIGLAGYFLARRSREIHADRLNARLERSFDELRRFTADASHELRTPLTALRTTGEVALRHPASPAQYRDVISSMLEEAARLTHIVDSLLLLARADSAPPPLHREPVALLALVHDVAASLEVLAEEKHQFLAVEGDPNLAIPADASVLRRVLMNLADNAIKYSPSGTKITLRVRPFHPSSVVIEVADQGPGIPPEHRAHIFDRFYRADSARSRETGGAGLGLAIANHGALAHGGRIELDCPLHGGSIFRLILPAESCDRITP